MTKRVLLVVAVALVLAAGAVLVLAGEDGVQAEHGPLLETEAMGKALGSEVMLHVARGHVPGRSAEVYLVPEPHTTRRFGGPARRWGHRIRGTAPAHPSPWNYTARVPLIFYGPGQISQGREIDDKVDIASVAPTYAEILGMTAWRLTGGL